MVTAGRRIKLRDIKRQVHGYIYDQKRYGDLAKCLRTPSKAIECAPASIIEECRRLLASPTTATDDAYPFFLINRRHRESLNSWVNENTKLFQQHRGNQAEMHPDDMQTMNLFEGDLIRVSSEIGSIDITVTASAGGRHGIISIPHGWGSRVFDVNRPGHFEKWGENRNRLVSDKRIDPLSQIPLLNMTKVKVEPVNEVAQSGNRENENIVAAVQ